ncbi:MAG TPA: DUF6599 family protein [Terriglobales bacterium]|nr:DUF6599 family protein [Terriglobales bacterium]
MFLLPAFFMKLPRLMYGFALVHLIASLAFASPVDRSVHPTQMLPRQFGGWQMSGSEQPSTEPVVADPVNADVLQEYGFSDFASATYTRDDGRKLTLKAARFADASGAYGAFTFYKMPEMLIEKIGDQGASLNERVLFYRGNILIDAVFQRLSAMSAAELRELADDLPLPPANTGKLPGLPAYLPKQSYVKNSAKYVLGSATLLKVNSPITAELVDFSRGAEVVLGNYNASGGEATLILISYPTPQIAGEYLRKIEAARQNPQQPGGSLIPGSLFAKRTGPIVVVAAGPLSQSEAKSLLASVNYDADVTWNENTYLTKKDNLANLLVNVILLCFIIIAFALVVGVAFGGVRILTKRLLPDRVFDRPQDMEFISLHLSDQGPGAGKADVSSSINAV